MTPDGKRAFVARGAAISVLNLETTASSLTALDTIEAPRCAPMALAYHQFSPATGGTFRRLFIAGGSLGLWKLDLCDSLFAASPSPCLVAPDDLSFVDLAETNFERQRCVDVAIVRHGPIEVLFALFAASSSGQESTYEGSELRSYELKPDGTTPEFTDPLFFPDPNEDPTLLPPGVTSRPAVGTALAVDPGDPSAVYAALGKDWVLSGSGASRLGRIWKVNILTGPALSLSAKTFQVTPGQVSNVRDLSIARVSLPSGGSKGMLYAALAYGGVLEYDLSSDNSTILPTTCGHAERIAAIGHGLAGILLAVGIQQGYGSIESDSRAPLRNNGLWVDSCVGFVIDDPDQPAAPACPGTEGVRDRLDF